MWRSHRCRLRLRASPTRSIRSPRACALPGLNQRADTRRILLIDGPTVIGWQKWREIDARIFGAGAKAAITYALGPNVKAAQIDVIVHL